MTRPPVTGGRATSEFGVVDIPNPAYTTAAHRNGVKSIATIYFDLAFRPWLTFREAFDKDPTSWGTSSPRN